MIINLTELNGLDHLSSNNKIMQMMEGWKSIRQTHAFFLTSNTYLLNMQQIQSFH